MKITLRTIVGKLTMSRAMKASLMMRVKEWMMLMNRAQYRWKLHRTATISMTPTINRHHQCILFTNYIKNMYFTTL